MMSTINYTHTHTHTHTHTDISRDPTKDKDSDDSGVGDPINEPGRPTPPKKQGFKVLEIDAEEYKAIDSYEAIGPGQIGFELGDVITVLDKMEDGESTVYAC